jgi:hypothetical protein
MRSYQEATCKNLLKRPLVMGVPGVGLLLLGGIVGCIQILGGGSGRGRDFISLGVLLLGYVGLRLMARFGKVGFEESLLFPLERLPGLFSKKPFQGRVEPKHAELEIEPPDTLDELRLIQGKDRIERRLKQVKSKETLRLLFTAGERGMRAFELKAEPCDLPWRAPGDEWMPQELGQATFVYSLYDLPASTDPLWIFSELEKIRKTFRVVVAVRGLDRFKIKRTLEGARLRNSVASSVDAEIGFEEASRVLEGIVRGDDGVTEISLVVIADEELPELDSSYFCLEKDRYLALTSILGLRGRLHRSHIVRYTTAADLLPTFFDPDESGTAILKSRRGYPCYFDPQDERLDALHWIVSGATGAGKSVFVGLILRRLLKEGRPMSVLFVDHGYSFRRVVRADGGEYVIPSSFSELEGVSSGTLSSLNRPGSVAGIELSDLPKNDKKRAVGFLLEAIERFLKTRSSIHPVYVVLDECRNYIMDEPRLVDRAFREYRKLNGAVVAITQSVGDFLDEEIGQAIFQNSHVKVLLRQGEDLTEDRRRLGLNVVELARTQELTRKKGVYSECLVKTPFLSRLGQLYPTEEELRLLRTDNLREERVREYKEAANA